MVRLRQCVWLLLVLAGGLLSVPLQAHDIPADVRIQAFLKPDAGRLRLLVRAPMAAMNDVEWPTAGTNLDLSAIDPVARDAAVRWIAERVDLYEADRQLPPPRLVAVRVALPSDLAFDSYDSALAATLGRPLPTTTELAPAQGLLDVLFEYPLASDRSPLSIDPRYSLLGLQTTTVLRLLTPERGERLFMFHDDPGIVRLDPRRLQAASRFVVDGVTHILGGVDHLLFLICLILPFRRLRPLVGVVTAFTLAHSITLIASAFDMAPGANWFPPLIETLIAASIVYTALENIVRQQPVNRWALAFAFGLMHGFGFSFALRDSLQLAGDHLITALLSFNIGIELGQLAVLAIAVPVLNRLFASNVPERIGVIVISAIVAHTGWHWMTERGGALLRYPIALPVFDAAFFALLTRWAIVAVAVTFIAWLGSLLRPRLPARRTTTRLVPEAEFATRREG